MAEGLVIGRSDELRKFHAMTAQIVQLLNHQAKALHRSHRALVVTTRRNVVQAAAIPEPAAPVDDNGR